MILFRFAQIGWVLSGLLIGAAIGRLFFRKRSAAQLTVKTRRTFERLGPTFVKLGQALSQRRDLLPRQWIEELSRLQERVSPFAGEIAVRVVEAALSRPLSELFVHFDREPLASASVAQVHRAQLTDGRQVIVKVLRPGVRARIDEDMRILIALVSVASFVAPALRRRRSAAVVREIWRNMRKETDLNEEARNIRRFARAFSGSSTIAVPDVIDGMSASDVLVQELSAGLRVGDPRLEARARELSRAFIEFYLEQFFVVGLFHADPHPGNIFVMEDGRLCFHDFGAVGFLDEAARAALLGFVQALIHEDPAWMTEAAADLGLVAASADRAAVARGIAALLADLAGAPLADWSIANVMLTVARLGGGDSVVLPAHLAALVRTVFTAEGTLRLLDPKLDVLETLSESSAEFVSGSVLGRSATRAGLARLKWEGLRALRAAPALAAHTLAGLRRGEGLSVSVRAPEVIDATALMDRAANRIALALVTLGLYIASSLLMQHSIGPRLWGEMPLLAALGYGAALWLTAKLVIAAPRA